MVSLSSMVLQSISLLVLSVIQLPLVYTSWPGRAEPDTIKFGDSRTSLKFIRCLPNLIIKFGLYVEPLPYQCRTQLIFIWFDVAMAQRVN